MRADRLLSILLLLQGHGRMTGRELAKRLEVSPRTVHRDMEALGASGVPVFALRGSRGGWQLDDGWRTRVPGLDTAELSALLMAQPRVLGDERLARSAERAIEKLVAALPVTLREEAASIRQRLHVDTAGWSGIPENLQSLATVHDAVSRDRKLVIRYEKPDGTKSDRTVDPLGLVAKSSAWYLVAGTNAGLRTFRVSRIQEARVLDSKSERPSGFDLASYWRSSTEELLKAKGRYEVTLRVGRATAERIRKWRPTVPVAGSRVAGDGGYADVRVYFDDEEQARFIVLGLGPHAEVRGPASFREHIRADIDATRKHYVE